MMDGLKISGIWSVPEDFQNKGIVILDNELNGQFSKNLAREGYLSYSIVPGEDVVKSVESAVLELRMFCLKIVLISFDETCQSVQAIIDSVEDIDAIIAVNPLQLSEEISKVPVRVISSKDITSRYPVYRFEEHESDIFSKNIESRITRSQTHLYTFLMDILQFI